MATIVFHYFSAYFTTSCGGSVKVGNCIESSISVCLIYT